jgi:hypothetical protein
MKAGQPAIAIHRSVEIDRGDLTAQAKKSRPLAGTAQSRSCVSPVYPALPCFRPYHANVSVIRPDFCDRENTRRRNLQPREASRCLD